MSLRTVFMLSPDDVLRSRETVQATDRRFSGVSTIAMGKAGEDLAFHVVKNVGSALGLLSGLLLSDNQISRCSLGTE